MNKSNSESIETRDEIIEKARQLIYNGEVDMAISVLNNHIDSNPLDDEAFFLRGNAWRKKGDNRLALNNYLEAIHINPDTPAQKAHDMLMDILNFYNKDMYNQ